MKEIITTQNLYFVKLSDIGQAIQYTISNYLLKQWSLGVN